MNPRQLELCSAPEGEFLKIRKNRHQRPKNNGGELDHGRLGLAAVEGLDEPEDRGAEVPGTRLDLDHFAAVRTCLFQNCSNKLKL